MPAPDVLIVDLDGTLIRTDLLHECFWAALAADWRVLPAVVARLARGRAGLKRWLAGRAVPEPATLPYNEEVLARVRRWRAEGGRTVLVTASDQTLAERVAAHLQLFDEVFGSDGEVNLKGARKAEFLVGRYGVRGFVYMGDAPADLAVWEQAAAAVTVGADAALRRRVERLHPEAEHLAARPGASRHMLAALRPHQWLKNALVFLPVLAAHRLESGMALHAALAFIAFSLASSGVYVLNDLLDLAHDRAHPRKRLRPFASGALPVARGLVMVPALFLAGGLVALTTNAGFLPVLVLYVLATTAYSLGLKRIVILDICALGVFYTLRIAGGAAATGLTLSIWLAAFSLFFFLSLAAVKRQAELVDGIARGRLNASGRGYQASDVTIVAAMAVAAGFGSVLLMALYINSPAVLGLYQTVEWLWGICLVLLYWIGRVVMIAHRGQMHDDPVVFALRDRPSRICLGLVLALTLAGAVL